MLGPNDRVHWVHAHGYPPDAKTSESGQFMADEVSLRDVRDSDLPILFEHQRDIEANHMAAFTSQDPSNWHAFQMHWERVRADKSNVNRTILLDGRVVGNIVCYQQTEGLDVGYWIDKAVWGRGVATRALEQFLRIIQTRPLFARVAFDNIGSLRVLQKCGFVVYGKDISFSNARNMDIEELLLRLDA